MPAKKPELGRRDQDLHPSWMPTEPSESESELTGERQPGDGGGPTNTFTMEKTRSADLEFGQLQYTSEADVSWTREARVGAQEGQSRWIPTPVNIADLGFRRLIQSKKPELEPEEITDLESRPKECTSRMDAEHTREVRV